MRIVIFTNGKLSKAFLRDIRDDDYVIGVDRAAYWLIQHGITPHAAVGDFDSVTAEELVLIRKKSGKLIRYPAEKDATDTELAVHTAIRREPEEVIIFGGVGSRLDHVLGNIHLLEILHIRGIDAYLRDERNEIFLLSSRRTIKYSSRYRYVSLLPYTGSVTVSLRGFKYPLVRAVLRRGSTRGISNEMTGKEASIRVHEGIVVVIRSKD